MRVVLLILHFFFHLLYISYVFHTSIWRLDLSFYLRASSSENPAFYTRKLYMAFASIVTKSKPCPIQWSTPQRSLHIITFVLRNLNCRPVAIAFCYLNLNQSCQRLLDLILFSATCSFKKSFVTKNQISNSITTLISQSIWEKNLSSACSQQSWLTSITGLGKLND